MTLKIRLLAFIFISGLFSTALVTAQTTVPSWAKDLNDKWYAALHAGDAAALSKMYTADAVVLSPTQAVRGRSAIEAYQRKDFAQISHKCKWTVVGAQATAKLTAIWGTDVCTETPKSGGSARTSKSRWLTVFERQPDGSWLIARDSFEAME
jgi:uncharacterized protein (TIGR02246 family)